MRQSVFVFSDAIGLHGQKTVSEFPMSEPEGDDAPCEAGSGILRQQLPCDGLQYQPDFSKNGQDKALLLMHGR